MSAIPPKRLEEARRKRVNESHTSVTHTKYTAEGPRESLPSQNVQLEEKLLSILLYDGSLVPEVRHIFRFPDGARIRPMYADINQRCLDEMFARYDNGEIPEFETMYDAWVGDDPMARKDERELLNKLRILAFENDSVLANREKLVKQWATRLFKHAMRRSMIDIATTAAGIAHLNEEQAATGDPFDDITALADHLNTLATSAARADRFRLKSIPEIRQRPRSAWILPGILQERKLWMIYGDSNTGKSFLALDWGLCFATGTPWQGLGLPMGHIVYVCAEGIDGLRDRLDAWLSYHGLDDAPNFHVIDDSPNLLESGDVLEVIAQVQTLPEAPIAIIFDTLADSMPGGRENDGEDYGTVISAMRRVQRECGCGVMTVHHTGKDISKGPRGHNKFRAAMDTAVEVSRDENTSDMIIKSNKQRERDHFDTIALALQSVALDDYADVTSCVLVASNNPPPTPVIRKPTLTASCVEVLKILESCTAGIRAKDLINVLVTTKIMSKQTMYNALNELLANHRVEKGDGDVWMLV